MTETARSYATADHFEPQHFFELYFASADLGPNRINVHENFDAIDTLNSLVLGRMSIVSLEEKKGKLKFSNQIASTECRLCAKLTCRIALHFSM